MTSYLKPWKSGQMLVVSRGLGAFPQQAQLGVAAEDGHLVSWSHCHMTQGPCGAFWTVNSYLLCPEEHVASLSVT